MCKSVMLIIALLNGIIFAQNFSRSAAIITAKLINGAGVNVVKYELDKDQLSKVIYSELRRNDSKGILLHFAGNNVNSMMINYSFSDFHKIIPDHKNSIMSIDGSDYAFKHSKSTNFYLWISDPVINNFLSAEEEIPGVCTVSLVYN